MTGKRTSLDHELKIPFNHPRGPKVQLPGSEQPVDLFTLFFNMKHHNDVDLHYSLIQQD